jgi:hypothetical protein
LWRNAQQIVAAAVKEAKDGDWRRRVAVRTGIRQAEQRVEVETPGTLAEIQAMTPEERTALRRRLLREYPELGELVPGYERRRTES